MRAARTPPRPGSVLRQSSLPDDDELLPDELPDDELLPGELSDDDELLPDLELPLDDFFDEELLLLDEELLLPEDLRNEELFDEEALLEDELPEELFVSSLAELLAVDSEWVPASGGEDSLYLRPFMIATEVGLGVRPSSEYLYAVIASPAGPYFSGGVKPMDVWLETEYTRAALGGTGTAKCGGNYAASLLPQSVGAEHGCAQVAYLDAEERTWIEEMGSNNLFFVFRSEDEIELVTPELRGSVLAGITRDSLMTLADDMGITVVSRRIAGQEWLGGAANGLLTEVFGCGTAAVITPIGTVKHHGGEVQIGGGEPAPVTLQLRERLTAVQRGAAPDEHGWMHPLVKASASV